MMKKLSIASLVFLGGFLATGRAAASVPDLIPVGGYLTDLAGQPLEGQHDLVFSLWSAQTGGDAPLWSESYEDYELEGGVFTVYLGEVTSLNWEGATGADELWLGVQIDEEQYPDRIRVGAVPYAFEARTCEEFPQMGCEVGKFISGFAEGQPVCAQIGYSQISDAPTPTAYTAGTGLVLVGSTFSISDSWVADVLIADLLDDIYVRRGEAGSVTDGMLAGGIAPSKIAGTALTWSDLGQSHGIDADMIDGLHADAFSLSEHTHSGVGFDADMLDGYDSVDFSLAEHDHGQLYVAKSPTTIIVPATPDPVANGQALLSAMAAITDASASNPYVLRLEAGEYRFEVEGVPTRLMTKAYVDIEGAGRSATLLVSRGPITNSSTVYIGSNCTVSPCVSPTGGPMEIRNLTIRNTGEIFCTGSSCEVIAIRAYNSYSMSNVSVEAYATHSDNLNEVMAVFHFNGGSVKLRNVSILAKSLGSRVKGVREDISIRSDYRDVSIQVIYGGAGAATVEAYGYLNDRSTTLRIANSSISVARDVTSSTSANATAMMLRSSTARVENVVISTWGAATVVGMDAVASTVTAVGTEVTASGGTSTTGVRTSVTSGSGRVELHGCRVVSSGKSLSNGTNVFTGVSSTLLSGTSPTNTGTLRCVSAFDQDFNPLTCS
ncbi:MAG: hypothetical protein MUC50_20535 [Myxococcota bacterium]|nr:hypothetical protein [Myxococcota bacterium]